MSAQACHTPHYSPGGGKPVEIFDASFAPISASMTAHYVWIDTENDRPQFEHVTMKIVGALTRHYIDTYGEVVDTETVLSVQHEQGSQTLVPAWDYLIQSSNAGFIGCYRDDHPPTREEVARVALNTWNHMQREAAQQKAKAAA